MADLKAEIEEFFRQYSKRWNSQRYGTLEELWDTSEEPFYRAMEMDRVITTWKDMRRYWNPGVKMIDGLWNIYRDLQVKLAGPDVAIVFFVLDWDIKIKYSRKGSSGSDPGMAVLRRMPDGWRMAAYVEACMSPQVYVRKMFESQVRPSFVKFLEEIGPDPKVAEERKGRPDFW
jgi:hypothetical protein